MPNYVHGMVLMMCILACGFGIAAASEEKLPLASVSLENPIHSGATLFEATPREENIEAESLRRDPNFGDSKRMTRESLSLASHDRPTTSSQPIAIHQAVSPREGGEEPTEIDLQKTVSMLRYKYEYLDSLDSNHEKIKHQLLLQEENFIIHEIELTDQLMNEVREGKITQEKLRQEVIDAEVTRSRLPMGRCYSPAYMIEQLLRRPWKVWLGDFFGKVLGTPQYKRKQISLNLRKLRSKLREPHHQFSDNLNVAIYRLSILDYYGFDFSKQEASLIKKMLKGSLDLSNADLDLISKITQLQAAQISTKLSELKVYFSQIPTESLSTHQLFSKNVCLSALQELQDQATVLNKWSEDKTKLVNQLARMREMNEIPHLRLEDSTQLILEHVLDESRQSDEIKSYAKTLVMLEMKSRNSEAEREIIGRLRHELERHAAGLPNTSTLLPLPNLPAVPELEVSRCVDKYDHALDSGRRLIKHAQKGRARTILEAKHITLGESPAMSREGVEGLEKLRSMDPLSERENPLLGSIKEKGDPSFTQLQKQVEKPDTEDFILETEDLPSELQEMLTAPGSPRIQGLRDPLTMPKTSQVFMEREIEELVKTAFLDENAPEIKDEPKAVKMLKIIIKAAYKSHNTSKTLVEKLAELKNKEIQSAKSQYQFVEDKMKFFESLRNLPGLEKVLHKLDPTLSV